ncbi:MAG: hypothetical protein JWP78_979 [Mucilaginibacter sp.]|nr:hypothetical protein [Mucilaginibacter sp.]
MDASFQKGQKVITPDGEGLVEDILDDEITVRLNSGIVKSYSAGQLEDNADQG